MPRRLDVNDADQLSAREHRHGQLTTDRIECVQIAGILANIVDHDRDASGRCCTGDSFIQFDDQAADHLFAMANGIADAQALIAFVVKKNRKEVVRDDVLDNGADIGEQLIEVESFRGDARHFEQEVEELDSLAETDGCFSWDRHGGLVDSPRKGFRIYPAAHGAAPRRQINSLGTSVARGHALRKTLSAAG